MSRTLGPIASAVAATIAALVIFAITAPLSLAHGSEKSGAADHAKDQTTTLAKTENAEKEGLDHTRGTRLVVPMMNPAHGRKLFVSKACVTCHAINGVGGHDAPNLDAHTMEPWMNPFEFAAKMWRGAAAMVAAQESALGEQILFTGQELADIIAFVHDDEEQHKFREADIPPAVTKLMDHDHGGGAAHQKEIGHPRRGGHHR